MLPHSTPRPPGSCPQEKGESRGHGPPSGPVGFRGTVVGCDSGPSKCLWPLPLQPGPACWVLCHRGKKMEALTPPRPSTVPMLGCWEPPGQPQRAADTGRGRTAQAADGWPPLPRLPSHTGMHPIGKTSVPERTPAAKRAELSVPQCPVEAAGWGLCARLPLRPARWLPEQSGGLSVRGSPSVPRSRCVLCA